MFSSTGFIAKFYLQSNLEEKLKRKEKKQNKDRCLDAQAK